MINVKQTFKLYDVVNKHFCNDEDSKILVSEIEEIMDNKIVLNTSNFATKQDLLEFRAEMKEEFSRVWFATKQDINDLKYKTEQDINFVRLELSNLSIKMEQGFRDQLKWIIVLMVSFLSIMITVNKLL